MRDHLTSLWLILHCVSSIDRSHITTAIWWPLGVAEVSVTCMRAGFHIHGNTHSDIYFCLNQAINPHIDKSLPHSDIGFRYEASLNFHTYFGQCPIDDYILLHIPLSCLSQLPTHGPNDCHGP